MKKTKILLKAVAFSLAIMFVVEILPMSTLATEINNREILENSVVEAAEEYSPEIVGEVESLRDEYTKHFRREDGSFVAAVYNEPVHYQKNGEWKEIDNTPKVNTSAVSEASSFSTVNDAKYIVSETSTPVTFPNDIRTGEITISKDGNVISFGAKSEATETFSTAVLSEPEELMSTAIEADYQAEEVAVQAEESNTELIADTNTGAISYENAFENASLEYEVSSSRVKESIVVSEKSDNYRYEFSIDFGEYIPLENEDGGIYIYESEQSQKPVMAILPPYMFDAKNETSDAVTMELVQTGSEYTLIVEADANWINAFGRKFPVVIDPTFELDLGRDAIYDVHVNKNYPSKNYDSDYQLEVGRYLNNIYRTYIRYDLPALPDLSVITYANIKLIQNWSRSFGSDAPFLNVYECPSSWNLSSINWNNQPISNPSTATIVDYTNFINGMSAEYNLNITKIVKKWYENGQNYGLMLASSDESVKEKTSFYSSRNIVSNYPVITINYINNSGIESYWDYETVSMGDSGTAYINTYNGGLTYIHEDMSTNGLVAPVGISHVYSTDSKNASGSFGGMKFGGGFSLNILERIEAVSSDQSSNYPYKYIDSDGTVHFFKTTSTSNQFEYEFNSRVLLNYNANSTSSRYVMNFDDGSSKHFNSSGYLVKTIDQNGNTISINYSGNKISNVTDGAGKTLTFNYNYNNTLRDIADPAGRKINFTYAAETGQLIAITYPEGNQTFFSYNDAGLLTTITKTDLSQIRFEYKSVTTSGATIYRVSKVSSHTCDLDHTLMDYLSFDYRTGDTSIKNKAGEELVVAFDNSGRAVNKTVDGENVSTAGYNQSGNKNNTLSFASNSFISSDDISNASYPARSNGWTVVSDRTNNRVYSTMCTERLNTAIYSLKIGMTSTEGTIYSQHYNIPSQGETYTVSGYVSILNELSAGTVSIRLVAVDSNGNTLAESKSAEITSTDNNWKILTSTITIPANTAKLYTRVGLFEGIGTVYIDSVWLEKGETPNRFNLIKNPSFTSVSSGYPYLWGCTPQYNNELIPEGTSNTLKMIGNPKQAVTATQSQEINGKAGDVLVFGSSSKGNCSSSGNNGHRFYGMRIYLKQGSEIVQTQAITFNREVIDTWQTILGTLKANQDYSQVGIELCYEYEVNSALFDNVFVFRDSFGTYYSYNNDGLIKNSSDDNGNSVEYTYNPNHDLSRVKTTSNSLITNDVHYSYNSNHNLTSITQIGNVTTTYTYPETGNKGIPKSVTVADSLGRSATTTYDYYDNYNFIKSITDPTGATVEYEYDYGGTIKNGLLTKVTDPNGNVTEYTYDDRSNLLTSVSNPDESLGNPQTEFTYSLGKKLSGISNSDINYSFAYNDYGTTDSVGVSETLSLVTNQYDSSGRLDTVTYGNGSTKKYVYDNKNRVSAEIYDGSVAFQYYYNKTGNLGKVVDNENDTEWIYQYDLAGRLICTASDDNRMVSYSYNSKNETENIKITDNNSAVLNTHYSYDEYGTPTSIDVLSMPGTPSQRYTVDDFGRVTEVSNIYNSTNSQNKVQSNYAYATKNGNQTGIVDSISFIKSTADGNTVLLPQLSYAYDANGNITNVYENGVQKVKYYYDGLNRLVREDNGYIDKTVVYGYDKCGDILSKTEYALTSSETLGTPVDTINYAYTNSNFKNGVTLYDGTDTIEYDENGNPVSYRGYSMVWTKGRQLAALSDTETTMSFKYDCNGIRTKKTVNGVETKYTYVGSMLVSQKTGDEVINFAYTAGGAPYGFTYNGQSYFYLLNLQGDVIGIYDGNGNVVVEYTYDSWGKLISITGSLASTIGIKNPLRYRGYYYDTETSLYYLQSRYYDPETCRFINADSLLVAGDDYIQGTNMFSYCYNNPVMYSDPTGYAVDGTTNNVVEDMTYYFFGILILKTLVYMSDEDIVYLVNEIEDSGDFYYVSTVIFNGYNFGFLPMHEGIKGRKSFEVCRAFLNKNVCLKVAEYYAWAYEGDGNAITGIAQEIYGHAMLYYNFDSVKDVVDHILNTIEFGNINDHADPVDLGDNPKIYTFAFEMIWKYM